jgi:hypothetical protein
VDVIIHIPDDIAGQIAEPLAGSDLPRRALEAPAVDEFKNRRLTKPELRQLLGFETRYELDGFLKSREVWDELSLEDLQLDLRDLHTAGF